MKTSTLSFLCLLAWLVCSTGACTNLGEPNTLGPDDIPDGAEPITTFNGEWLSEEFGYAVKIDNRMGTVTLSNSSTTAIGDVQIVIQSDNGDMFNGLQIFSDGSIQNVIGRLVDPNTLRMTGAGITWTLIRISPFNFPPEVSAVEDQSITLEEEFVDLVGMVTDDGEPDGILTSTWSQESGPDGLEFDNPSEPETSVTFTQIGVYVLQLEASDGEKTASATVTITVNSPPTAEAGEDAFVAPGEQVTLDGSGSTDPDEGDELSFTWTQTTGPDVTLSSATEASTTFIAPAELATMTFELTVTDGVGQSSTDTVAITVE